MAGRQALYDWQETWVSRAIEILGHSHFYFDNTIGGRGKTYMTLEVASRMELPIGVICPKTAKDKWIKTAKQQGIKVLFCESFAKLRSRGTCELVTRLKEKPTLFDQVKKKEYRSQKEVDVFKATPYYAKMVRKGMLLVVDEGQNTRNNSLQTKAVSALIEEIMTLDGGMSRLAILSYTLYSDISSARVFLAMLQFIPAYGNLTNNGMKHLIERCKAIDEETTEELVEQYHSIVCDEFLHALLSQVVMANLGGAAVAPDSEFKVTLRNGFLRITDKEKVTRELKDLEKIMSLKGTSAIVQTTKRLMSIEKCKVKDIARVVRKDLEEDPSVKVGIGLCYLESIEAMREELEEYDPLVMTGSCSESERADIVESYNSDPDRRVLIMNITVGGTSIDLHDTVGDAPRRFHSSTSYKAIETVQFCKRIDRVGVMSDSVFTIWYGDHDDIGQQEKRIMDSLSTKSLILQESMTEETRNRSSLPRDFETYIEEDH